MKFEPVRDILLNHQQALRYRVILLAEETLCDPQDLTFVIAGSERERTLRGFRLDQATTPARRSSKAPSFRRK
jgi:hypothetical protein